MNTISVENLPVVSHSNNPVITTELLAQLYGTEPDYIRKNYSRNTDRFVPGKHYFLLEGDKLREFKHSMSLRPSVKIARNVRSLILWTERGAARHAKMLETDQAWEVFEKLEDCYFNQPIAQQAHDAPPPRQKICITLCGDKITDVETVGPDMYFGNIESIVIGLRERGWIVIRREMLAEKLAAM